MQTSKIVSANEPSRTSAGLSNMASAPPQVVGTENPAVDDDDAAYARWTIRPCIEHETGRSRTPEK
jgi:hypothetical protein